MSTPLRHLMENKADIINIKDTTDTLAATFSTNSLLQEYQQTIFFNYEDKTEKQKPIFKS